MGTIGQVVTPRQTPPVLLSYQLTLGDIISIKGGGGGGVGCVDIKHSKPGHFQSFSD